MQPKVSWTRRGRHLLEIAALRSVAGALRLVGIDRASALMGRLWRAFGPFNARTARADLHLRVAMPQLDAAARAAILRDMWDNLGRTAAETLLADAVLAEPDRIDIADDFRAAIASARAAGRGMLFCALHSGNWEIGPCATRQLGVPVLGIYKRLTNPYSEDYLKALRLRLYEGGLMEAGASSILKLRAVARQGHAIAMLSDLPDATGLRLPFFGHASILSSLPVAFARRLGLPLIVCRSIRLGGVQFRVEGHLLDLPRSDDVEADIRSGTAMLHATYERWIAERPGEWMWSIRKWGRHPEELLRPPAGVA